MEIGKPKRSYTIEPIEDPVPAALVPEPVEEHILPVRDTSDVILEKGPDHAVRRVRLRVG